MRVGKADIRAASTDSVQTHSSRSGLVFDYNKSRRVNSKELSPPGNLPKCIKISVQCWFIAVLLKYVSQTESNLK